MTFPEYQMAAHYYFASNPRHLRMGQSYYNTLAIHKPDLAEAVPLDLDPFHDDRRIHAFLQWVEDRWDNFPE